jgi:hypothetical protein
MVRGRVVRRDGRTTYIRIERGPTAPTTSATPLSNYSELWVFA